MKNRNNLEVLERVANRRQFPAAFKDGNELIATGNAKMSVSEHHVDATMKKKVSNSEKYKQGYFIWIENHLIKAKQHKKRPDLLVVEKSMEINKQQPPEILRSPGGHKYLRFHLANSTKTTRKVNRKSNNFDVM